ncbi:hypothetical protein SAMN05421553_3876 [Pseudomonas anguilliseptica]|uniref:Uncharacterized protein n=1 Tax=Pseudomonas anguilliseptica TaxID=53406 RepID=A0A1H5FH73_PSEAG|nr:hypothetical protein SAMN05421553_3876 [Pseudomonas anguilliseptica]
MHPMRSPLMAKLQHCLQINWRKINQVSIIYLVRTTL